MTDPIKRLIIYRMSQMMVHGSDGPFINALKNLSSAAVISAKAKEAEIWVEEALTAVMTAPDSERLGLDTREKAANAILVEIEKRRHSGRGGF